MTDTSRIERAREAIAEGVAKADARAIARHNARAAERERYEADITAAKLALSNAETGVFEAEMALSESIGARDKARDAVNDAVKRLEAAGFRTRRQ